MCVAPDACSFNWKMPWDCLGVSTCFENCWLHQENIILLNITYSTRLPVVSNFDLLRKRHALYRLKLLNKWDIEPEIGRYHK